MKRRRVTIEEVEDDGEVGAWAQEFFPADVATPLGEGVSVYHDIRAEQESVKESPYAPFRDAEEWGLAKWLMRRSNQAGIDEYLKLDIVS